jgi:cysteine desulfurase
MKLQKRLYFDYNATTSIDPAVLKALVQALKEDQGNPSSIHSHGQQSRRLLEQSRQSIASFFHVQPSELIFTSGGTEAANLLLQGVMQRQAQGHLITSSVEHSCVYQTAKELEKKGCAVTFLNPGLMGAVSVAAVEEAIRTDTRLISLMTVNNETGVKTDIEAIAQVAQRHHIPFIVDGVAWLGKEVFQIPAGVSAIFFSGHKIHAPKGIGLCVCRASLKLAPLLLGGEQEYNRRPGTENIAGIVALAEAIHIVKQTQAKTIPLMQQQRDYFEQQLQSQLPDISINGEGPRICNTSNLCFHGVDGESLLMTLDVEGVSVSHGSACSSGALEPSRILLNMGLDFKQARSSIRFSFGRTTTQQEVEQAIQIISQVVNRLRNLKKNK